MRHESLLHDPLRWLLRCFCLTKTPFTRSSPPSPFTSTTIETGSIKPLEKDSQDGYFKPSSPVLRSGGYCEMTSLILPRCRSSLTTNMPSKHGIAKNLLFAVRTVMHQQQFDLVAGDFNGAAWRRRQGSDPRPTSIIEEAFVNNFPVPPGTTPLWVQEACQVNGRTCVCS